MLRANRILRWHTFLSLFLLLLLSANFPAWAEETEKIIPTLAKGGEGGFEQSTFILEVTDNLINLKAEQASFKEILNDLEKKTDIFDKLLIKYKNMEGLWERQLT
jgi:hypothetical protein